MLKMKRLLLLSFFLLSFPEPLLARDSGTANWHLDEWIGQDANSLMVAWGAPDSAFDGIGGMKFVSYKFERQSSLEPTYRQACTISFTIDGKNFVSDVNWKGKRCNMHQFPRPDPSQIKVAPAEAPAAPTDTPKKRKRKWF